MDTYHEEAAFGVVFGTCLLLFFIGVFFFAVLQSQKRQLRNKLEKDKLQKQFQESILEAQLEVQNQTLFQIGQELHDNIGQLLSVARIFLSTLEEEVVIERHSNSETFTQLSNVIDQLITEVRSLSKSLDASLVRDFGFLESLNVEIARLQRASHFSIRLVVTGEPFSFSKKKEIILFRVAQELLNNSIKHSMAKMIEFQLMYTADSLSVTMTDNGKGFDYEAILKRSMGGSGLKNVQDRVKLIDGTCEFVTSPGSGFRATLHFPA